MGKNKKVFKKNRENNKNILIEKGKLKYSSKYRNKMKFRIHCID